MPMHVKFWGVRGSIACPGPETARYGGNTACIEIICGGHRIILDGGTGLRPLGNALVSAGTALNTDLLLTHCHLDHVAGLPFFAPLFAPQHSLRIWAGNLIPKFCLEKTLRTMMSPPLFPIEVESFKAAISYHDFEPGTVLQPHEGLIVQTGALNHPGGATGYRIECGGKSVAYLTDTELRPGKIDHAHLSLAHKADLLIFDTTYTEAEIASRRGWGHSTWNDGVRLADEAGAKRLCLFHHDPNHDDAFMDDLTCKAAHARPGTIAARDGLAIDL